jgi:zinc transport system substrate-binding protein
MLIMVIVINFSLIFSQKLLTKGLNIINIFRLLFPRNPALPGELDSGLAFFGRSPDMKKLFALLVFIVMLVACAPNVPKFDAVALFYPLYDVTRNIAGDKISVKSFIPAGVEPHSFDPSPSDLMSLSQAKVFVGTGINFEGMEERFENSLNKDAVTIHAFDGIDLIEGVDVHEEESEEEHDAETEEHEEVEGVDPHVWLSPKNMIIIANNVKEGLKRANPENTDFYERNAASYVSQLQQLDSDFHTGLSSCKKDKILTTHAAFSYLARDYGFEQVPVYGLSPEAEPTPHQIIALIEAAKANDLKYVFYEELVDPRVSQTIASEVGAQTLALNPVESGSADESYISIMRGNLNNLRVALECE